MGTARFFMVRKSIPRQTRDCSSPPIPAAQAGWYPSGSSAKILYKDQPNNGQAIFPKLTSTKTTFTPTGAFGLFLDGEYSQDSKNPLDLTFNNSAHSLRFFPAIDASGNV